MKKILLSLILTLLLATGAQANQESGLNVERLTVKSELQLHLNPGTKDIVIKSIELTDDNYGRGRLTIKTEVIMSNGQQIEKQYQKYIEAGHDYYYEMLSGPMKKRK